VQNSVFNNLESNNNLTQIDMPEWVFNRNGRAVIVFDDDCLRNGYGQVVAWIYNINVYDLNGNHIGWYEHGILYDSNNNVLGFIRNRTGHLPSIPGIGGIPGTPGFAGKPGRPGLGGTPGRAGFGGWSNTLMEDYF
jgi:hypothetical protein